MPDRISIIVPAYNIEHCLGATLDTLLAQTYRDLEVIVVDDGSTDGTADLIDAYAEKDPRIRAVHKENGGVTSARLRGIREATGQWIGFADGDDTIEPDMYERLLRNAETCHADISHCGYQMVLPSGRVRMYYGTGKRIVQDNHTGLRDLLSGKFIEPGLVNKLFSRRLLESFLRDVDFDGSIRNNEDLLMNYYLFRNAAVSVYEDVCPYHYIVRPGSAANSAVNIHQLEDPLKVRQILFRETETDPELHAIAANQLVRQLVTLATMDPKADPSLILPVRKNARRELRGMLGQILTGNHFSLKIKIMSLWAAILPGTYQFVHKTYEKVTGLDKIYEK